MFPRGATRLFTACCFNELVLWKTN